MARVCLDLPVAHLDRPFDYAVPESLDEAAQPGCLVRVRFNGRLVNGWLLERRAASDHPGKLAPLHRVRSVPVLTDDTLALASAVADRYAGSLADVLRSVVPPRHARAEAAWLEALDEPAAVGPADGEDDGDGDGGAGGEGEAGTDDDVLGGALAQAVAIAAGSARPGIVLTVPPALSPVRVLGHAIRAALREGKSVLIVVPDHRDLTVWRTGLDDVVAGLVPTRPVRGAAPSAIHVLRADDGPAKRYRTFLEVLSGHARVVVGTRSAAFAPLNDLGLMVIWDDGDPLHAEPHAPGWHAREVLALRAWQTGVPLVVAGHARSAEAQRFVESGWAAAVTLPRVAARRAGPRVRGLEASDAARDPAAYSARLPHAAFEVLRAAVTGADAGPALVSVPRRGYLPAVACASCRELARCAVCDGLLELDQSGTPTCIHADHEATANGQWSCRHCDGTRLRATSVGAVRTVEELARAFPEVQVVLSGSDAEVLAEVGPEPRIVVATPGAEPVADGGYLGAVILDAATSLRPVHLRSVEEVVRRWFNLLALCRREVPVFVTADSGSGPVQALVRLDPATLAAEELAERTQTRMPPATRCAVVAGEDSAVRAFIQGLPDLPEGRSILGPVPGSFTGQVRGNPPASHAVITVPVAQGAALARSVRGGITRRSEQRDGPPTVVRIDPTVGV